MFRDRPEAYGARLGREQATFLFGGGLAALEGDPWRARRRLLQPAFHPDRAGRLAEIAQEELMRLTARWDASAASGQAIEGASEMRELVQRIIQRFLFGRQIGRPGQVSGELFPVLFARLQWLYQPHSRLAERLPSHRNLRFRKALEEFDRAIDAGIEAGPPADLLALMAAAGLDLREQRDEAKLFMAAADALGKALTWLLYVLASRPEIARQASEEAQAAFGDDAPRLDGLAALPYARMVIQELLRLYSPSVLLGRQATADDQMGQTAVKRGTLVFANLYSAHRHPDFWPEPEAFRPERWQRDLPTSHEYAYLPFGKGSHTCLAQHIAVPLAQLTLATLAGRYQPALAPGARVEPEVAVTFRPRGPLLLSLSRR